MVKNSSFRAIIALISLLPSVLSYGQLPTVRVEQLRHCCTGHPGMIEVSFEGDTTHLRYEWSTGSKSRKIENLAEGTYTLHMRGELDCDETQTEFKIKKLESPQLLVSQQIVDDCFIDVRATVLEDTTEINPGGFRLVWSDSTENIAVRRFRRPVASQTVCASIESLGSCAFSDSDCESLSTSLACGSSSFHPKILVNEFSRRDDSTGEFIELLVPGDGICGNTTDIRFYSIMHSTGIGDTSLSTFVDKPILQFSGHDQWARVPNGSLITIYNRAKRNPLVPPDDIYDADVNGSYILPSNNSLLLQCNLTDRIVNDTVLVDIGSSLSPSWTAVDLHAGQRSGIHIRYPDGSLCHGYTVSATPAEYHTDIPFRLINTAEADCGCMLDLADYMDVASYTCDSIVPTPGYANSPSNDTLIRLLRNCGGSGWTPPMRIDPGSVIYEAKEYNTPALKVFPNPAESYLYVVISNRKSANADIVLYSTIGQAAHRERLLMDPVEHVHLLRLPGSIQPGLYLLQCRYDDGSTEVVPVVILNR